MNGPPAGRMLGRRVLIVDCSNFSMSDEPALHEHFHLPQGTKPGIGYPLAMVMGLIDAASGMFVQMLCLPLLMHDMAAVVHVHAALQNGDILLGDRAVLLVRRIALLNARASSPASACTRNAKANAPRASNAGSDRQKRRCG